MHIKNSMKSVIAQGATVVKAIEEALRKADMPQEFFIKILEEAQSGFLGFGAKKAKIALFFRKEVASARGESVLHQSSYDGLFNNQALQKQIENQQKDTSDQVEQSHAQVIKKPQHAPRSILQKSQNTRELQIPREQVQREQAPRAQVPREQAPRAQAPKPQVLRTQHPNDQVSPRAQDPADQATREQESQAASIKTQASREQGLRPVRQPQRFEQRELKTSQLQAQVKYLEKPLGGIVKPERRLQDIPQRPLTRVKTDDDSGQERSGYRGRRRSRYYSSRKPRGDGEGSSNSESNNNSNNNDSSNT